MPFAGALAIEMELMMPVIDGVIKLFDELAAKLKLAVSITGAGVNTLMLTVAGVEFPPGPLAMNEI